MHTRITPSLLLILFEFFSTLSLSNAVQAQGACTPVVLAFRHAEDFDPIYSSSSTATPRKFLTPTGATHAALYPAMVPSFLSSNNYCPLGKVYAANPSDGQPGKGFNTYGAPNAFCTARPLAKSISQTNGSIPSKASLVVTVPTNNICLDPTTGGAVGPIQNIGTTDIFGSPIIYIGNIILDEYLQNKDIATNFLAELKNDAKSPSPTSSAIFWTSQGLHQLGSVIAGFGNEGNNQGSVIPLFSKAAFPSSKPCVENNQNPYRIPCGKPPRNAVYVFTWDSAGQKFNDTPSVTGRTGSQAATQYLQCYNHTDSDGLGKFKSPTTNPPQPNQYFYCAFGQSGDYLGLENAGNCNKSDNRPDLNPINVLNNCKNLIPAFNAGMRTCSDPVQNDMPGCNGNLKARICNTTTLATSGSTGVYGKGVVSPTGPCY